MLVTKLNIQLKQKAATLIVQPSLVRQAAPSCGRCWHLYSDYYQFPVRPSSSSVGVQSFWSFCWSKMYDEEKLEGHLERKENSQFIQRKLRQTSISIKNNWFPSAPLKWMSVGFFFCFFKGKDKNDANGEMELQASSRVDNSKTTTTLIITSV